MSDIILNPSFCPFSVWIINVPPLPARLIKRLQLSYIVLCLCRFLSAHLKSAFTTNLLNVFALLSWGQISLAACILRWGVILGAIRGNMAGWRTMSSWYHVKKLKSSSFTKCLGLSHSACQLLRAKERQNYIIDWLTDIACLTPGQPVSSRQRPTAAIVTLTQMQG